MAGGGVRRARNWGRPPSHAPGRTAPAWPRAARTRRPRSTWKMIDAMIELSGGKETGDRSLAGAALREVASVARAGAGGREPPPDDPREVPRRQTVIWA